MQKMHTEEWNEIILRHYIVVQILLALMADGVACVVIVIVTEIIVRATDKLEWH